MPKLIMISGPSGSGKSTEARKMLAADGNSIRINRDEIRLMSLHKWTPRREAFIIEAEIAMATAAAEFKCHIIVDDTNLTDRDEAMWKHVANKIGYEFQKKVIPCDLKTCIERDAMRKDHTHIGPSAITRQFLRGKLIKWPTDRKVVIFDIDGTLADLTHRTNWIRIGGECPVCTHAGFLATQVSQVCPFCENTKKLMKKFHDEFYSRVGQDKPIDIVIRWAQEAAKHYMVLIVSGRSPEKSEDDTIKWLAEHGVPYELMVMRRSNMHGPDDEEKQKILDLIIQSGLPKEQIEFVVDDRPSVVRMWKRNGIRTIPVRGRDDDEFYELMNDLEETHPRPDLEAENEG